MLYPLRLQPGESRSIDWRSLLYGPKESALPTGQAAALQAGVADAWRDKLDRVRIRVPAQGQRVVDTLRTSLAHMLISRIGRNDEVLKIRPPLAFRASDAEVLITKLSRIIAAL